ncbi:MAG TPA: tetratricopeptide repeat protein [Terriglobia bacterium]|nr:tetratricopeptide repeat protein [Terriglobia bacterium]
MTYRLAIPASILLLSLTVPSVGQTTDESSESSTPVPLMQTPTQVSTTGPPTIAPVRQLTKEEQGDLMMARKEFREAEKDYRELTEQDPRNAVFENKLGIAKHQQMDLRGALKCYERAVKLDHQYADAQNNIGTIWYQRKKYGKAIRAYKKAIKLRPDMAVLYSNLGYAYFGDKKYEESIGSFRQALAIDPAVFDRSGSRSGSLLQDRSVWDRGRFYYLLAKSFAEAGNLDRCLLYLRKAKDEGYKSLSDVKTDPAFAAMLKLPAIQEVLTPPAADTPQP